MREALTIWEQLSVIGTFFAYWCFGLVWGWILWGVEALSSPLPGYQPRSAPRVPANAHRPVGRHSR